MHGERNIEILCDLTTCGIVPRKGGGDKVNYIEAEKKTESPEIMRGWGLKAPREAGWRAETASVGSRVCLGICYSVCSYHQSMLLPETTAKCGDFHCTYHGGDRRQKWAADGDGCVSSCTGAATVHPAAHIDTLKHVTVYFNNREESAIQSYTEDMMYMDMWMGTKAKEIMSNNLRKKMKWSLVEQYLGCWKWRQDKKEYKEHSIRSCHRHLAISPYYHSYSLISDF